MMFALITAFNKLFKKSHRLAVRIRIVSFSIRLLFQLGILLINCWNAFNIFFSSPFLIIFFDSVYIDSKPSYKWGVKILINWTLK